MSGAAAPPRGWAEDVARASAWALLVLVPVHVALTLVLDDPGGLTAAEARRRWDDPAWRALDWTLVVVALVHGALGTWRWGTRAGGGRWRPVAAVAVVAVAALLVAALTVAVLVPPS